jgi:hypothetical protein
LSGTTTRGFAAAILSVGGVAGLFALWSASSAETAELSPAQTVAYRFPMNWSSVNAAASVTPKGAQQGAQSTAQKLAPAVGEEEKQALAGLMFSAKPAYGLASASSVPAPVPASGSVSGYDLASASSTPVSLPERANAYADPNADGATGSVKSGAKPRADKPHVPKQTNNVLNDAQIASIKTRLKLTPDQQRNWPAVEAALRNITYKKDAKSGSKLASVDPNSQAVQDLKNAAIPLIMSFSDAQKDEVRTLARLMGLEQVAQSF